MVIKRGDIFYADLSPVVGSEQGGIRPVLVVQNDIANKYAPTVIVIAITSQINRAKLPTHIEINAQKYNLAKDSVILVEQTRTIDKKRLREKISHVNNDIMDKVSNALMIANGVDVEEDEKEDIGNFYKFRINETVNMLEDYDCEFKEIKGPSPINAINSTVAEYVASFLNSRGGRIYYGITNARVVKGVNASTDKKDDINKIIYNNLANIQPAISPDHFEILYHAVFDENNHEIKDLYVIEIFVSIPKGSDVLYFVNGTELHVRVKGIKKKLIGTEITSFFKKKFM